MTGKTLNSVPKITTLTIFNVDSLWNKLCLQDFSIQIAPYIYGVNFLIASFASFIYFLKSFKTSREWRQEQENFKKNSLETSTPISRSINGDDPAVIEILVPENKQAQNESNQVTILPAVTVPNSQSLTHSLNQVAVTAPSVANLIQRPTAQSDQFAPRYRLNLVDQNELSDPKQLQIYSISNPVARFSNEHPTMHHFSPEDFEMSPSEIVTSENMIEVDPGLYDRPFYKWILKALEGVLRFNYIYQSSKDIAIPDMSIQCILLAELYTTFNILNEGPARAYARDARGFFWSMKMCAEYYTIDKLNQNLPTFSYIYILVMAVNNILVLIHFPNSEIPANEQDALNCQKNCRRFNLKFSKLQIFATNLPLIFTRLSTMVVVNGKFFLPEPIKKVRIEGINRSCYWVRFFSQEGYFLTNIWFQNPEIF